MAGPLPPNPDELIDSERMREVVVEAQLRYDLVVIDTPPTSVVSDAIPLMNAVSGVIVVGRLGRTSRDSATSSRGNCRTSARGYLESWSMARPAVAVDTDTATGTVPASARSGQTGTVRRASRRRNSSQRS